MRAGHLLLIFLFLIAVGSQMYVSLWEHRDAPQSVRLALLAGSLAVLLLALLVGPQMARRGRRGGPILVPV